jgi:ribonuclease HI
LKPAVTIYTDGGCQGNPGPGAWACVVQYQDKAWELAGAVPATTNNRMELQAAIQGFKALNRPCQVNVYTDSDYLRQGITTWIRNWRQRGWRTKDGSPVKNQNLWSELDVLAGKHSVDWHWLKGHAGHRWNERCDTLATEAIRLLRKNTPATELHAALQQFLQSQL